jgi:hypothetical protein
VRRGARQAAVVHDDRVNLALSLPRLRLEHAEKR